MFEDHLKTRMILLVASLLTATHLTAEVLSPTTTDDLVEPEGTYDLSAPSLLTMRVKTAIETGACVTDDYVGCTLQDVLDDIDGGDDFKPEIRVHMTADDYPDDGLVSNAEMRQRGATSRGAPQKSFRVKLDKEVDLWRGERRLQLIKSFWDFSRIRNKLSYDLFVDIPNLPSMRTQFVNFKVEDQGVEEDYGLYTQVEYFGKEYLVRRGWDEDSRIYKAEYLTFKDNPAYELDAEGKPLDVDAFETLAEIKRGDDHRSFVKMIKDLNNSELNFNTDVFDKYFDKNNYLTWFAVNLLLGNPDTHFHNFYLYNPIDNEKFYFVPWDYDLSLGTQGDELPRYTKTHANWWGEELHKQFLRQPGNVELLREAMDEIRSTFLTQEALQQKADSYYPIVFPIISTAPDIDRTYVSNGSNPEKIAAYNLLFSSLAEKVAKNYDDFVAQIADPMPFWIYEPAVSANQNYRFSWAPSESLSDQTIIYDFDISTSPAFDTDSIIVSRNGLEDSNVTIPWSYGVGSYFYRVIARDASDPTRYWQVARNRYTADDKVYNVRAFDVTTDISNNNPVGIPDAVSTTENTASVIDVLANDLGVGLILKSTNPWSREGGTVEIVNNKISYKPKRTSLETDKLWYVLEDAQGRSHYAEVTITIAGLSSGNPVGNPDVVSTPFNTSRSIDVLANDSGSGLSLVSSNPFSLLGGNVSITDDRIVYTPKLDFVGEDKLWYVFQDHQGRTTFSGVTINVSSEAPYPVALTDEITTAFETAITFDPLVNDEGADLKIINVNSRSKKRGKVVIEDGKLLYTPKAGYSGEDSFWYAISDSLGRTNSAKVFVTVTPAVDQ